MGGGWGFDTYPNNQPPVQTIKPRVYPQSPPSKKEIPPPTKEIIPQPKAHTFSPNNHANTVIRTGKRALHRIQRQRGGAQLFHYAGAGNVPASVEVEDEIALRV